MSDCDCGCEHCRMRQLDHQLRMTKDNHDKQKILQMCNEMLEFLTQDDVVYSIRETGTVTNMHVELDFVQGNIQHSQFSKLILYAKYMVEKT